MSLLKRLVTLSLLSLLVTGFMTSCDKCVHDDLTDCPQGVIFKFHTQTPCEAAPSYPSAIKETRIFAFDEQGVLMSHFEQKEVALTSEYEQKTDYLYIGTSSFVAWAGEDLSKYDFSPFEVGKTTKQEMMVALKRQADQATADMPHLYVGEPVDGDLTQEDRRKLGTHYDIVDFRLQQLTNQIELTLTGLKKNNEYEVKVIAANALYDIMGKSLEDSKCNYIPTNVHNEEGMLKTNFRLLQLEEHKGIRLVVTNRTSGKEVYNVDLIDDLIKYKGSPINLACEHDFVLKITLKEKPDGTYIIVYGYINDWNLVPRDIEL